MRGTLLLATIFLVPSTRTALACGGGFGLSGPLWGPSTSLLFELTEGLAQTIGLLLLAGLAVGPIGRTRASWAAGRLFRVSAALLTLFSALMMSALQVVQSVYPMRPQPCTTEAIRARDAVWGIAERAVDVFPWVAIAACVWLVARSRLRPDSLAGRWLGRSRGLWLAVVVLGAASACAANGAGAALAAVLLVPLVVWQLRAQAAQR